MRRRHHDFAWVDALAQAEPIDRGKWAQQTGIGGRIMLRDASG